MRLRALRRDAGSVRRDSGRFDATPGGLMLRPGGLMRLGRFERYSGALRRHARTFQRHPRPPTRRPAASRRRRAASTPRPAASRPRPAASTRRPAASSPRPVGLKPPQDAEATPSRFDRDARPRRRRREPLGGDAGARRRAPGPAEAALGRDAAPASAAPATKRGRWDETLLLVILPRRLDWAARRPPA